MTTRTSTDSARDIPEATVARLPVYLRALVTLAEQGTSTCSSEELAAAAGVNSAKLRKDLSYLGSYGTRGVGYDVEYLRYQIARADRGHPGLARRHRRHRQPRPRPGQLLRLPQPRLPGRGPARRRPRAGTVRRWPASTSAPSTTSTASSREHGVAIGVIATPAGAAQDVADQMVAAGIRSILNFAPTVLAVPDGRRRPQGRPVDRAADPGLPRAAQGQAAPAARHRAAGVPHERPRGRRLPQVRAGRRARAARARRRRRWSSWSPTSPHAEHVARGDGASPPATGWRSTPTSTASTASIEEVSRLLVRALRRGDRVDGARTSTSTTTTARSSHLFHVAAGLDSMVVGEGQILGQIRDALRVGQELGTVGPALNSLFQQALRVGKRAHAETDIDHAAPSLVERRAGRAGGPSARSATSGSLVVGAGTMASLAVATARPAGAARRRRGQPHRRQRRSGSPCEHDAAPLPLTDARGRAGRRRRA